MREGWCVGGGGVVRLGNDRCGWAGCSGWVSGVGGCGVIYRVLVSSYRERPYHAERTGSHSNAEVKARGTSWEP